MNDTTTFTVNADTNQPAFCGVPKETIAELSRLVGVLDKSMDGVPSAEVDEERRLLAKAKTLDADIQRLLSAAGMSRTTVGADSLPALEREARALTDELTKHQRENAATQGAITSARAEIKAIDDAIADTKEKQKELLARIARLEFEIRDRTIVEDVWYWIFPDGKKAELKTANEKRDAVQQEIQTLVGEIHGKKERRNQLESQAASLSQKIAAVNVRIRDGLKRQDALRKAIAAAKENQATLAEIDSLRNAHRRRADNQRQKWGEAAHALKTTIGRIRESQPRVVDVDADGYGRAQSFPEVFSFGRYHFQGRDGGMDLSRLLPFPLPKALFFPAAETATDFIREFMLRAFQCLPPEHLEITVCDPVKMGASLNGFQELKDNRKPFPERKFLTVAKEIEDALARLHGEIDSFLQNDCTGEINDWSSYNAAHPARQKTYRLLVMFDMSDQLSDAAATYLEKIVRNGPKSGVLPLLTCNPASLDPRRRGALREALESEALDATSLRMVFGGFSGLRNMKVTGEFPSEIPDEAQTAAVLSRLRDDYARRDKFAGALETLWEQEPLWEASSADGLEAAIGWREDDRATPVLFSVGRHDRSVFHTLLGGKTGSGKSNLVHVLLHSLCHRYSPEELNLYMLDYKEAVEFNSYTKPLLPHAAGIATESDVEYGLSVLRHLNDEMERRSDAFKEADVQNIYDYRMKTRRPMARILLVVDEFQRLFETVKDGEAAEAMLGKLVRQGRSAGIHLLLATQTLSGLRNLASARSLISQISCRIALACIPEDSMTLLQNDNLEAASLDSPPQGIYNDNLGVKSANVKFIIPEAVAETRRRHLEMLHDAAAKRAVTVPDCHVFNGAGLPDMPPPFFFAEGAASESRFRLPVGRTADFDGDPVFADMAGKNLLVIGRQKGVDGVKEALAEGLGATSSRKAFMLYTERPELWSALEGFGNEVVRVDDEWDCDNLDEFAARDVDRKIIILDGFDNLRALRSTGFVSSRNGPSAAERLRTLVERPSKSGVQLVLCFRDYGRALSVAKDLLAVCEVRICDASVSDPVKFVAFDTAGAHDAPIPKGTKALLSDRDADGPILFRPFAPRSELEQ